MININEDIRIRINKKEYKLIKLSKYCEKKEILFKNTYNCEKYTDKKSIKKNQKKSNVYIIYKQTKLYKYISIMITI